MHLEILQSIIRGPVHFSTNFNWAPYLRASRLWKQHFRGIHVTHLSSHSQGLVFAILPDGVGEIFLE
jgi:hypothetical protein